MKRTTTLLAPALGTMLAAALLAGCGGSDSSSKGSDTPQVVDGGTFTLALSSDPGNLDPQSSAASSLFTVSGFAYDPLVSVDLKTGAIQSQLATKWNVSGKTVTLTLRKGITCSDGAALKASDVAANLAYVADPKNKSPFLGTFLPVGATAKADDSTGTVTISLTAPAPFVLNGLASLPIICPKGMADRGSLADSTDGTGPYQLTQAAAGDHYTYQARKGYAWGPNGATTATKGMPATVDVKIIQNQTTAANLLLSGGLSAATITGPDTNRLENADLFAASTTALVGEQWYNHADGHATSDPAVRMALTQALDLVQLQKVITSGKGGPATTLSALQPTACPGNSVAGKVPATDTAAASRALKTAAPPALTFLYDNSAGSGVTAAAELAVKEWQAAGVTVNAKGENGTALQQTLFGTGNWDIAWVSLNVNSPDQVVPFLSGPAVPNGTNFADIDNAAYAAGVAKASAMDGTAGCPTWLAAESNLFTAADLVPFANSEVQTFGAKSTFEINGSLVPTSIRMLAS